MTEQLGFGKNEPGEKRTANRRNGTSKKTLRTDQGPLEINVPRDRFGEFEPVMVPKHQRQFSGFDDKILSMYARGMSTREIADHLKEIYQVDVSPELISRVTDSVYELLNDWRSRPLDSCYPIIFLDALMVKVKEGAHVVQKAIYLALAITLSGKKEVLGLWMRNAEGSKFWMEILIELQQRGVNDVLIMAVDGLSGFPEAIRAIYPQTQVQLCIVHMVRNSLKYVSTPDRVLLMPALKKIYTAPTEEAGLFAFEEFCERWESKYAVVCRSWRTKWTDLSPFFSYPAAIRTAVYTTNAIESLNWSLRKVIRNRLSFPNDESAMKLVFMALQNAQKKWTVSIKCWGTALQQFAILFGDRVPTL